MNKHETDPKSEQIGAQRLPPENYDDEVKKVICNILETEYTRASEIDYKIGEEKIATARQKRALGSILAKVAAAVPLIMLVILILQLLDSKSVLACMKPLPQAVFISATFISFIAVYASLIKNIFQESIEKPRNPVMRDALEVLNTLRRQNTE